MKPKKSTHGGSGRGQGRHKKYKEPTTTVAFRVPVSKKKELGEIVKEWLKKWER